MAEGIGVDGIHCVSGTCDLCGDACDVNTQELNVLSCTFAKCEDLCYHQDCLEKYLKSIRLERNRKTGFKCPRGCGKGSAHKDSCPGKIDKSHPIHPRNEEQKKKKKAKAPDVAPLVNNRPKTKEERKAEKATAAAAAKDKVAAAVVDNRGKAAKPIAGNSKCATATAACSAAAAKAAPAAARPPPPPDTKSKLVETVAALRRELASGKQSREPTPPQTATAAAAAAAAAAAPVEYKTLDMYYRENAASSSNSNLTNLTNSTTATASVANAWAKPPPVPATAAGRHKQAVAAADSSRGHILHSVSAPGALHTAVHGNAHLQTLMSRSESLAAAAAATQLPPPPPPPPPPDQHHGLAAAALRTSSSSSSIPTPPAISSTSNAAAAFHAAANGHVPVGMEYLSEEEQQHLTKAQRKNLKRAEKKKKKEDACIAAAADAEVAAAAVAAPGRPSSGGGASSSSNAGASSSNWASPGTAAPARGNAGAAAGRASPAAAEEEGEDPESLDLMYELAVQALLAHKTLELVASLQRLGFTEWQAAAAVQRFGSDVEDAVAWLLDGGAPSAAAAAAVSQGCVAQVDITEDLSVLEQLLSALMQVPRSKLYQAVADTGGDLDAAAAVCLQQTEAAAAEEEEEDASAAAAEQSSTHATGAFLSGPAATPFQRVASSDYNAIDSSSLFNVQPGLYGIAGGSAAAAAADAAYTGWLNGSSTSGIGLNGPVSHRSNASSSLAAAAATSAALRAGSSDLGFLAPSSSSAAAAAAGLGSIWTTEAPAAASSSIWAQGRTSSGLFGAGSSSNMSLMGPSTSLALAGELNGGSSGVLAGSGLPSLGLGLGSGLNQQQPLNPQQSLSAADPVLETFSSGSLFSNNHLGQDSTSDPAPAAAAAAAAGSSTAGALASGVSPALQGSRLFQSYGWRQQQSLFGEGAQQQQQQQQVVLGSGTAAAAATAADSGGGGQQHHDVDETDLEGLMATLMCH